MPSKIFVSYAHADERLKDEFLRHLMSLKREGLIELWQDRALQPGEHLNQAIEKELSEADLVILLISSAFLSSDYCVEVEMVRALERAAKHEMRAIAVVLKPCQWQMIPISDGRVRLGDLVALPLDAKPITTFSDRDVAWSQVVGSIRAVLEAPKSNEPSEVTQSEITIPVKFETQELIRPTPRPLSSDRTFAVYLTFQNGVSGPSGKGVVEAAATYAHGRDGRVVVVGHTDGAENDLLLSKRRAIEVAIELIKLGISDDRLEIGWLGSHEPATRQATGQKEPLNRRVTISIE